MKNPDPTPEQLKAAFNGDRYLCTCGSMVYLDLLQHHPRIVHHHETVDTVGDAS